MPEDLDAALAGLRPLLLDEATLVRAVAAGRRRGAAPPWRRVEVRPTDLKSGRHLQVVTYDERAVNDKLKQWCEGGGADHVAVRRYLIDMAILSRSNGLYARTTESLPDRGAAERYVTAMGLD